MINAISREGRKPGSCKEMDEANKPSPVPSAAERKRIFWEKVQAKKKVKG